MPNPASALGEAVGKSVEREIQEIIKAVVAPYGLLVDAGGIRKGKRTGRKLLLVNETGNSYQIDVVVEDQGGNPLILVESKYLRYKKHNRDKGSWTCVAHYKLRTTYPTVKKSIAVLMGNWTESSMKLMKSFGVDILEIPFEIMVSALIKRKINFEWEEKDSATPRQSWLKYSALSDTEKQRIAQDCLIGYKEKLEQMILEAVLADPLKPKNVDSIEILIKTTHDEYFIKRFSTTKDSVKYLLELTTDVSDLKGLL